MQGMNAATGAPLTGLDHLRQSIRDILRTRIGTRVMLREYGSEIPALIDNPTNQVFALDLYIAVARALRLWEPRVRLRRVALAAVAPGSVTLDLEALYTPDGRLITLDGIEIS